MAARAAVLTLDGGAMRAARLISLVLLLQSRGRMTAAELARELEVSERTVYRDVLALAAAGVPVYADRGRAAGAPPGRARRVRLAGSCGLTHPGDSPVTPFRTAALYRAWRPW